MFTSEGEFYVKKNQLQIRNNDCRYAHCMMECNRINVKYNLNIPSVCPATPAHNSAFCEAHGNALKEKGFSTIGLRKSILNTYICIQGEWGF